MSLIFSIPRPKTKRQPIKRTNVVFIQRRGIYYVSLPEKSVKDYTYPSDMVVDGDVINRDSLYASLLNWITTLNIKAIDTYCIVSEDSLFQKVLYPNIKNKTINEEELSGFTDSIPYQRISVMKKTLKDGSRKIIVANRDLLSVVLHALEQNGLNVLGIYPEPLAIYEGAAPLNSGDYLGDKAADAVAIYELKPAEEYSFDLVSKAMLHKPLSQMSVTEAAQQPIDPMYAVLAVVVLVVIAAGVGYWQYAQVKQRQLFIAQERARLLQEQQAKTDLIQVSATDITTTPTQGVTSAPTPQASQSGTLNKEKIIRVQLVYSSQAQKLYEDVYAKLELAGLYQISGELGGSQSKPNRMLTSPTITSAQSSLLIDTLTLMGVSVELKQATIDDYDVVIELNSYSPTVPSPISTVTP